MMYQHEEQVYRLIFENSIQGMALRQGEKIILVNQRIADMMGYTIEELLQLEGEKALSLFPPSEHPALRARYQQVLAGQYEHRFLRKDGTIGWCTAAISTIQYQGEVAVLYTYLDTTERKRLLSDLITNASLPIAMGYADGRIGITNPAFWNLTGYTEEELQHIAWNTHLTPPEWQAHEAAQLDHINRTRQPARYEKEYVRKDGTRVPIELLVHPQVDEDGQITSYFAFITDITQRKHSESELLESEAVLRATLNAVTESVILVDADGTILTLNDTAAHRFGRQPHELIGATAWDMHPEQLATARFNKFQQVLATGRAVQFEDQRENTWFDTSFYPAFDAEGKVMRVVIFARDITERKQAQQSELAYTLEKERGQILKNFIRQASHEFRTPLSTINTSAYMIQKTNDLDLKEHHTRTIKEQTKAIGTLVNALMTMVRVDSAQALATETISLTDLLTIIVQTRHEALHAKRLHHTVHIPDHPLVVQGNMQYLQQAIECLLDNAIQFTPDGGTITITLDSTMGSLGESAAIRIKDTGVGIRDADLPFIFDRFFRADKVGTTRGFGLGLTIAKAIIDQHRGFIEVVSIPGAGSTFTIHLPVA
ncbi:MAG: PAS domain S-box protein [Anaerolineae bacterium]|nr:PAS domain S-box protein [Anaerolineae bacterium]